MEVTNQPTPSQADQAFNKMVTSQPVVARQPIRTLASKMIDGKPTTFKPQSTDRDEARRELLRDAVSIAVMYDDPADKEKALQLVLSRKTSLNFQGEPQYGETRGREGAPVYYFRVWKDAPQAQTIDDLFA